MGQNCPARPNAIDPGQGLRKMTVGRMRLAPHTIDNPNLDAIEHRESAFVEFSDIGRICEAPDAKTETCDYSRDPAQTARSGFPRR